MKKGVIIVISLVLLKLFLASTVYADTIRVSFQAVDPAEFIDDEERNIQVTVNEANDGYLRVAFYKPGSRRDFFGCTKGAGIEEFYCGSTPSSFPAITAPGVYSLTIKPDINSPHYQEVANEDVELIVMRCLSGGCSQESKPQPVHLTKTLASPEPVDCEMSPWSECTKTCGEETRTRAITVQPTNGGKSCEETTSSCNLPACSTPPPQGTVSLSEFVACAPGPEWVELYNSNDFEVTLNKWEIRDDKNQISDITGTIGPKNYKIFDVSNLDNDGDTVRFYNNAGNPLEQYKYISCISTQSWAKTSSGSWQQTSIVTKGGVNKFPTPVPTSTPTPSPSITPSPSASPTSSPEILGESTESGIPTLVVSEQTAESIASKSSAVKKESPLFAILAILLGIISLLTLGGYLWYDWKKKKGSSVISQ